MLNYIPFGSSTSSILTEINDVNLFSNIEFAGSICSILVKMSTYERNGSKAGDWRSLNEIPSPSPS